MGRAPSEKIFILLRPAVPCVPVRQWTPHGRTGETGRRPGRDGPVTTLAQQSHIAGQRRRITGDIDHPLRRHPGDGVDDGRMQPLARRVHRDDIRPDSVLSQFLSGLAGVGAEEIRVLDAVAPGVFPGVGDGLLDDLHPDDPFAAPAMASVMVPVPQ